MKCCLKQNLATKHRPISKECFICRMAYEYQIIMRWCPKFLGDTIRICIALDCNGRIHRNLAYDEVSPLSIEEFLNRYARNNQPGTRKKGTL